MTLSQLLALNLHHLTRQRHLPAIRLLFLSLLISITTVTAISLVTNLLKLSLTVSSTQFIAGDRQLVSPREIDQNWLEMAKQSGLAWSRSIEFSSMLFGNEQLGNEQLRQQQQLVTVKAVDDKYPLKGGLLVRGHDGARVKVDSGPQPNIIWLQQRLFPLLGLAEGDSVDVGEKAFVVSHELIQEPDASFQFAGLAPRVLIHFDDVAATGVIQPGSRLTWRYYFTGTNEQIVTYEQWLKPKLDASQHWQDVKEGRPAIAKALEKTETYLLLGGSLAVLLACVAVAMAARQFALSQVTTVAIMKSIGVKGNTIVLHCVVQLLLIGFACAVFGLLSGLGSALLITWGLSLSTPELHDLSWSLLASIDGTKVLLLALGTAFISLFGFALPQFIQLRDIPPMRVLRQEKFSALGWSWKALAWSLLAVFALLYGYSQHVQLVLALMLSVGGVIAVLLAMSWLSYFVLGRSLPEGLSTQSIVRQAVYSLLRRRWGSLIQLNVLSLALLLLTLIVLARSSLITDWQNQLPAETPNHFLINIAPSDLPALQTELEALQLRTGSIYPMVRGRLSHINDRQVKEAVSQDVEALNRELNLTWASALPEDNRIEQGVWWTSTEAAQGELAQVSVESGLAEKLGLKLADTLTFRIGGVDFLARVTSIRSVQWDSMRPNFYMMFSPHSLDSYPLTYITAFYLPIEQKPLLNPLGRRFPTVSILELDQLIEKLRSIISQVSSMIELILVFIFLAALLVIAALISSSIDERSKEAALMRALGAHSKRLSGALFLEFALLGWVAAWVALLMGELVMWLVQKELFDATFTPHYFLWLWLPILSALLIGIIGYWQIRRVVQTSPMVILRNS